MNPSGIPFFDEDNAPIVLLLHGFLENRTMWDEFIPEISLYNKVIAIDLLGHGESQCIGDIHTMEQMADAVHDLITHLEIEKAILVGHSMGGYVSLAFANKYPARTEGVCLFNSTPFEDTPEKKINRDRAIKVVEDNPETFISMGIANLFEPERKAQFQTEIQKAKEEGLKTPKQGVTAALAGMKVRPDYSTFFVNANFKKLMILGQKDPVLDCEQLQAYAAQNEIDSVVFPDGHMSHIENKEQAIDTLIQWLQQ